MIPLICQLEVEHSFVSVAAVVTSHLPPHEDKDEIRYRSTQPPTFRDTFLLSFLITNTHEAH